MKILILVSKFQYPNVFYSTPEIFPQGPAYIAGALEAAGHEVRGLNISYDTTLGSIRDHLQSELHKSISDFQPHLVALGGLSADYIFIRDSLSFCRSICPELPVCIGGGLITADKDYIFEHLKPNFAIYGEGEVPIVQLVEHLEGNRAIEDVTNLLHWNGENAVFNQGPKKNYDLNSLAYPSYDCLGLDEFFRASSHRDAYHLTSSSLWPRVFPVSAGRSCPFSCTFCFHSASSTYQQRPIKDVLNEISHFYEKYQFNIVTIYDELFSVREARVLEFCEGWHELKLPFKWTCALRVPDITPAIAKAMKKSGAYMVGLGLESASNIVLQSMKKKITRAQIENAFSVLNQADLGVQGNFILGDPAETESTIEETADFFKQQSKHCLGLGKIAPFPGSELFETGLKSGKIKDKKSYYESIATCAKYNLTNIPDDLFNKKIEKIFELNIKTRLYGDISKTVFIISKTSGNSNLVPRKNAICKITCPHCNETNAYNYSIHPEINYDIKELKRVLPKNQFVLCRTCFKFFVINFNQNLKFYSIDLSSDFFPTYENIENSLVKQELTDSIAPECNDLGCGESLKKRVFSSEI